MNVFVEQFKTVTAAIGFRQSISSESPVSPPKGFYFSPQPFSDDSVRICFPTSATMWFPSPGVRDSGKWLWVSESCQKKLPIDIYLQRNLDSQGWRLPKCGGNKTSPLGQGTGWPNREKSWSKYIFNPSHQIEALPFGHVQFAFTLRHKPPFIRFSVFGHLGALGLQEKKKARSLEVDELEIVEIEPIGWLNWAQYMIPQTLTLTMLVDW